jgi:hypothetical protein
MSDTVKGTLIGAVLAIIGSLAVAFIGWQSADSLQDAEINRIAREHKTQVREAARLLDQELRLASVYIEERARIASGTRAGPATPPRSGQPPPEISLVPVGRGSGDPAQFLRLDVQPGDFRLVYGGLRKTEYGCVQRVVLELERLLLQRQSFDPGTARAFEQLSLDARRSISRVANVSRLHRRPFETPRGGCFPDSA